MYISSFLFKSVSSIRKELFVLEYNVIKQRIVDNVPMYIFQNKPKYMSSTMFQLNRKFIFTENGTLKNEIINQKKLWRC